MLDGREWSAYQGGLSRSDGLDEALAAITLCNNARLSGKHYQGDPTEGALLVFAQRLKSLGDLQISFPRLHESPFDSATKRMITTHRGLAGQPNPAYMKGAPEVVFSKCSQRRERGALVEFDMTARQRAQDAYERLAYKTTGSLQASEEGFIYLGLVGMLDPPRPEIPDAIDKCRTAGIRVFMITGDCHVTAESIARQVGLYTGDGQIVMGGQLENMDQDELLKLLNSRELVFARATPMQKLQIVKALQQKGEVVWSP